MTRHQQESTTRRLESSDLLSRRANRKRVHTRAEIALLHSPSAVPAYSPIPLPAQLMPGETARAAHQRQLTSYLTHVLTDGDDQDLALLSRIGSAAASIHQGWHVCDVRNMNENLDPVLNDSSGDVSGYWSTPVRDSVSPDGHCRLQAAVPQGPAVPPLPSLVDTTTHACTSLGPTLPPLPMPFAK